MSYSATAYAWATKVNAPPRLFSALQASSISNTLTV